MPTRGPQVIIGTPGQPVETVTPREYVERCGSGGAVDLDGMTKAELLEHAEAIGVDVGTSWSKDRIIDAIRNPEPDDDDED